MKPSQNKINQISGGLVIDTVIETHSCSFSIWEVEDQDESEASLGYAVRSRTRPCLQTRDFQGFIRYMKR